MNYLATKKIAFAAILLPLVLFSCKKKDTEEDMTGENMTTTSTLTVENVLNAQPLVESGTFQGTGTPPVVFPGQSVTIHFAAAKGEALSFVTMYGWYANEIYTVLLGEIGE